MLVRARPPVVCSNFTVWGCNLKGSKAMKSYVCAGLAVLAFAMGSAAVGAEKLLELDATGGTSTGHWVMVVSKAMAPNAPTGLAAMAVGNGDTLEQAYGMSIAAGKPAVGAVSEDVIKAERASDREPVTTTIVVKVTAEQHDAVKKIIGDWSAIKEHVDPLNDVTVNFAQEVIAALKMKRAFRGGLAPINPVQYFADLATVNRKFGQQK